MPVEFTAHALRRMWQRDVLVEDVEKALRNPIDRAPGRLGTVWIRGYGGMGQELRVCVRATNEDFVITAAWVNR
ncbi:MULTISPECIES: DUF4258 domain-containing protein [Catenuloplanes]|uniref:DUF4258 domain-containing protein n=1 Tax=Catenuloplanes niger TaxID=587534 RepID=A0AAE4CX70_9ACTN|nr:DUF4258 domain-containing protein [Catenuloplanes niger]MDR7324509.1 hypothetical protein [Catenuloplanes niger]